MTLLTVVLPIPDSGSEICEEQGRFLRNFLTNGDQYNLSVGAEGRFRFFFGFSQIEATAGGCLDGGRGYLMLKQS